MRSQSQPTLDNWALKAIEKMEAAQKSHISDLRLLIDQAHARESDLAGMVRMVMEERFHRPVITRTVNTSSAGIGLPVEMLSDVTEFDHEKDKSAIGEQDERTREIEKGFAQIFREEQEYRAQRGMQPVAEA